ncbi:MAG TPA: M23 family peptidase, partial [Chitinophagaceae bacterium]
ADNVPPVITPMGGLHDGANLAKASQIAFRLGDNLSGVKEYRAELDGKWLLFAQKGNTIYYSFDEHCAKGDHKLVLTVTDEANNQSAYLLNFKR